MTVIWSWRRSIKRFQFSFCGKIAGDTSVPTENCSARACRKGVIRLGSCQLNSLASKTGNRKTKNRLKPRHRFLWFNSVFAICVWSLTTQNLFFIILTIYSHSLSNTFLVPALWTVIPCGLGYQTIPASFADVLQILLSGPAEKSLQNI